MKKKGIALVMAVSMAALTACSSMPGMGVTAAPTTAAPKAESGETQAAEKKEEAAPSDQVYTLKISTSQTDQSLITQAYMKLGERVKENSGGRLEIQVFPSSQLGNDEDVIEQAIQGAGIAVNTDAARMGTYVKDMGILMMGYFADNYDECKKITETDTFKGWEDQLANEHGIRVLAFDFYDGPRHFMTNKEIKTPEDLKGQRIRTIGAEVCTETITAMGGTPIAMAWGEVYNGIQSKALDGCEAQNTSTFPSRIYEVCKYQTKTGHFQLLQALVCGEAWFQTLPEDLQKILVDTAREVGAESAQDVLAEADKDEKLMVEAGLTIVEPDLDAFKAAAETAYEKMGYTELREQLYKEIGKTN